MNDSIFQKAQDGKLFVSIDECGRIVGKGETKHEAYMEGIANVGEYLSFDDFCYAEIERG